jgi:hypothetical protein
MEGDISQTVASPRGEAYLAPDGNAPPVVQTIEPPQEVKGGSSPAGPPAADLGEALPLKEETSGSEHGGFGEHTLV